MSFEKILSKKYWKKLLDPATKTELDVAKTASKKVVHKTAEATRKLIGNRTAEKIVKAERVPEALCRIVEKIYISPEKKDKRLNKAKNALKMEHYQRSESLSDSAVSNFVARKWIDVNNLSSGQYSGNKNIRLKNPILRSDLCHYGDTYDFVKVIINVTGTDNASKWCIKNYRS